MNVEPLTTPEEDDLNDILRVVYAHAIQVEHPGSGCPCKTCIDLFP